MKKTTRLCEKFGYVLTYAAWYAGTAALISDVVRAMIIVKTMDGVDAVLEVLLELEAGGVIKIGKTSTPSMVFENSDHHDRTAT